MNYNNRISMTGEPLGLVTITTITITIIIIITTTCAKHIC